MGNKKSVLFIVPYPLHRAPSQRFRVELFLPLLQENNITYRIATFLDAHTWNVLYKNGSPLQKVWGVVKGFLKRFYTVLFVVPQYDYIFIHREASPVGPPIFEFIIAKLWRKKIIYDFDDAIWIPNTTQENKIVGWVKAFWKVRYICKWAYKVVGGNNFLCNYAAQFNSNVILIPTCVDMQSRHVGLKDQHTQKVVIGWTGSHSTMKYLDEIVPVLQKIDARFNTWENQKVSFVIISNKAPQFALPNMQFVPWQEASEVTDLLQMNIGVMPLEADPWCEGKCGFKLIQYMSLGIPAVASPVGVNKDIIEEGKNGYLCTDEHEWYDALTTLIEQEHLRSEMGANGKEKIAERYSIQANAGSFLGLFG